MCSPPPTKKCAHRYPNLDDKDQEAVRQHAVAALNLVQRAKRAAPGGADEGTKNDEPPGNTAFLHGVRRFAMNVRDLDIDLIARINPFEEAYAVLAKTMNEESLRQIAEIITAKRIALSPEEAKELAIRAFQFKKEWGRIPAANSPNPWEQQMARGASAFVRYKNEGRYDG
uniref:Uncharacterized protein n=1 Tax=Candidatus Kentrum sp. DK TaxID=2126562 RepID=A0A450T4W2_9GAMM|nr:MAG: hypothetical protein BECKDK2373B_GA0170837_11011 [Candidatus Kentron sp. DK]